jgi:predicted RecB family endonuclease
VVRVNGGAFKTERGGFVRCTDTPGTPDIMGCTRDGRALAVEVKSGRGRMSGFQTAFREAWVKRGGVFVLARGIGELEEAEL